MSAVEALRAARAAGIQVKLDGDDLSLTASAPPPAAVLEILSRHKADVVQMLRPTNDGWSAEDWQVFFEERAGIAEFDGCVSRTEAGAQAFACCVVEWLNRNPVHSQPGRCLHCCKCDHAHDPLLPYGIESTGHAWLHSYCWPAWRDSRQATAIAALATMGIGE
jgi:hypothetical protein